MKKTILIYCTLFICAVYAKLEPTEFFYSNNTQTIRIEEAYKRLIGKEQHALTRKAIAILKKNHMEQGVFKTILGTYTAENHQPTADNSEIFFTSPRQHLSRKKIFSLAVKLANQLHQESIAVFIPDKKASPAHIKLIFLTHQPTIDEAINRLSHQLPPSYSQDFSLSLINKRLNYHAAQVKSIEWLGRNLDSLAIEKAFPFEKIRSYPGKAYLVFKKGNYQRL